MTMAPRALLLVVSPRPLTARQGQPRHLVHGVAQLLVAGEAKRHPHLLPTPHGHGHHPRVRLQMPKRLAPPRRAHSVGTVTPCLPTGSVRAHTAAGMLAKKSSIACRYLATAAMTAANSVTSACISRLLARTTCGGTGRCGAFRLVHSSVVRAALR